MPLAHIGGIPVEEMALSMAPVAALLAAAARSNLHRGIRRRRP